MSIKDRMDYGYDEYLWTKYAFIGSLVILGAGAFVLGFNLSKEGYSKDIEKDMSKYESFDDIVEGVTQSLEVPEEDFNLIVKYNTNASEWKLSQDKSYDMEISTEGLKGNKAVFITGINSKVSLLGSNEILNGYEQSSYKSEILAEDINDMEPFSIELNMDVTSDEYLEKFRELDKTCRHDFFTEATLFNVSDDIEGEDFYTTRYVWGNKIDSDIVLYIIDYDAGTTKLVTIPSSIIVKSPAVKSNINEQTQKALVRKI